MLLLKLLLAPALVAFATLATRRWGPTVGGIVVGFPLSTGPIFLFLALEQGLDFAQEATVGILLGVAGVVAFALAYAFVATRGGWVLALGAAIFAFAAVSRLLGQFDWSLQGAAVSAYAVLGGAIAVMPRSALLVTRRSPAWWDLWVRMVAAALLTLGVTAVAGVLGPLPSGMVATFPVVSLVVLTFTHHQNGAAAARAMIRGSILSWFSFATFFLAIGLTLAPLGLAMSLALGAASVLLTSSSVISVDRAIAQRASNRQRTLPSRTEGDRT